ncbi:YciI family protein [Paucibacter sp. XJ19-41]|uniref:YciI family protein n=1 Tax=Paucibacter sp. XJ19-41 TaxID=2927824 RepID=UPI0023498A1D|nr:hypothetical protein [Paucibacter sp. XJ19-41]MDC6167448.1 hypothetical protein [Paucibacter sp. XJ19-41]
MSMIRALPLRPRADRTEGVRCHTHAASKGRAPPSLTRAGEPPIYLAWLMPAPGRHGLRLGGHRLQAHRRHVQALGCCLIAAGPLIQGRASTELIVFEAPDDAGAQAWLAADPAIQAGLLRASVWRWWVLRIRELAPTGGRV